MLLLASLVSLLDWLVGIGGKVSNNFVRGSFLRKYISVRMEIFELLYVPMEKNLSHFANLISIAFNPFCYSG